MSYMHPVAGPSTQERQRVSVTGALGLAALIAAAAIVVAVFVTSVGDASQWERDAEQLVAALDADASKIDADHTSRQVTWRAGTRTCTAVVTENAEAFASQPTCT